VLWWEETALSFRYLTSEAKVVGAKTEPGSSHSWNILGSYPTNVACEGQQAWKIGDMLQGWRKEKTEAKF